MTIFWLFLDKYGLHLRETAFQRIYGSLLSGVQQKWGCHTETFFTDSKTEVRTAMAHNILTNTKHRLVDTIKVVVIVFDKELWLLEMKLYVYKDDWYQFNLAEFNVH